MRARSQSVVHLRVVHVLMENSRIQEHLCARRVLQPDGCRTVPTAQHKIFSTFKAFACAKPAEAVRIIISVQILNCGDKL